PAPAPTQTAGVVGRVPSLVDFWAGRWGQRRGIWPKVLPVAKKKKKPPIAYCAIGVFFIFSLVWMPLSDNFP
ncbi:MAG: hypothetical protein KIH69_013965, partial [Anaerolineae bacterium]|nr:hypothetical protein [Anaerolineae bacterium]